VISKTSEKTSVDLHSKESVLNPKKEKLSKPKQQRAKRSKTKVLEKPVEQQIVVEPKVDIAKPDLEQKPVQRKK
jgi:hypothetical protein